MKQTGKGIENANLQLFLDSARNALDNGQQQFYTPSNVAASLFRPLPGVRTELAFDPNFGNGALALGSHAKKALGLDIDKRVRSELNAPDDSEWTVEHADFTLWYPIASEIGFTVPFISMNPPFSLEWHAERLEPLRSSHLPEVARVAKQYPEVIDSTLASFLIGLDLLSAYGEGFMVCNSNTARRFFGSPDGATKGAHPELMKFIWLWLEIPGAIYENQHTQFDTAVLYFAPGHANYVGSGGRPHYTRAASSDIGSIDNALMTTEVFTGRFGSRFKYPHEMRINHTESTFAAIAKEYAVRHGGKRPDWNIRIDKDGKLHTYLTPFQESSKRLDKNLIARLHALDGQTPISLCVTATSRTALREAAECGVWTIQDEVKEAIARAFDEFNSEGAPFNRPNETTAMGWVDEYSTLLCKADGIGECKAGKHYPISSSIETTQWTGNKINLAGEKEDLQFTGRELLVKITDPDGVDHLFHVRRDDGDLDVEVNKQTGEIEKMHWWFADLIRHFDIPIPKSITDLRPDEFARNLARMDEIQRQVNARMEAAAREAA